jgi:nucleoside-diphosphate-sugar epimerase
VNWRPENIFYDTEKPQGVASRAADLTNAKKLLNWSPKFSYEHGFEETINWYFKNKKQENVKANLEKLLMER